VRSADERAHDPMLARRNPSMIAAHSIALANESTTRKSDAFCIRIPPFN
jgi:hypothetical protein